MIAPRPVSFSPLLCMLLFLAALFTATDAQAQSCREPRNQNLDFGTIVANPTMLEDTSTTFNLRCDGDDDRRVKVCVALTPGETGPNGRVLVRNGSPDIEYEIYSDSARSIVWGSGAQALEIDTRFDRNGDLEIPLTLYGRIFPGTSGLRDGTFDSRLNNSEVTLSYDTTRSCGAITSNRERFRVDVEARVPSACSISANDLSFGGHISLASAVDASSALSVRCTLRTSYSISLDGGVIGNGNVDNRAMGLDGARPAVIGYQLFSDPNRSSVWGTRNRDRVDEDGTGFAQSFTVYGRVPAQPTPPAGRYHDTVTATVEY